VGAFDWSRGGRRPRQSPDGGIHPRSGPTCCRQNPRLPPNQINGLLSVIVEDVSSERVAIGTVLASLPAVGIATAWLGGQRTSPEFGNKLSVMYSDAINRHVSARTHRTYPHPHTHRTHPHLHTARTRTCTHTARTRTHTHTYPHLHTHHTHPHTHTARTRTHANMRLWRLTRSGAGVCCARWCGRRLRVVVCAAQVPHASMAFHNGDPQARAHLAYPATPVPEGLRELMRASQESANGALLVSARARTHTHTHAHTRTHTHARTHTRRSNSACAAERVLQGTQRPALARGRSRGRRRGGGGGGDHHDRLRCVSIVYRHCRQIPPSSRWM
jgi:hypothetical protein